jgi:hypothetical protein
MKIKNFLLTYTHQLEVNASSALEIESFFIPLMAQLWR